MNGPRFAARGDGMSDINIALIWDFMETFQRIQEEYIFFFSFSAAGFCVVHT